MKKLNNKRFLILKDSNNKTLIKLLRIKRKIKNKENKKLNIMKTTSIKKLIKNKDKFLIVYQNYPFDKNKVFDNIINLYNFLKNDLKDKLTNNPKE